MPALVARGCVGHHPGAFMWYSLCTAWCGRLCPAGLVEGQGAFQEANVGACRLQASILHFSWNWELVQ